MSSNNRVIKVKINDKTSNRIVIQRPNNTTQQNAPNKRSEPNQSLPFIISNNQSLNNITIAKPSNSNTDSIKPIPPEEPLNQKQKNLNFERLSLLSFVSSFEDEKSFNETDLEVLGLDLKCQEPLLPMLHSVLSDAPLLDHSRHPMPECYSKIQAGNPAEKLSLFTPKTLLFIFYTYPRDPLQIQAAAELIKRQWVFDEENEEWRDQDGNPWSVDQWRELDENQIDDS